jgi:hypothetical protein
VTRNDDDDDDDNNNKYSLLLNFSPQQGLISHSGGTYFE